MTCQVSVVERVMRLNTGAEQKHGIPKPTTLRWSETTLHLVAILKHLSNLAYVCVMYILMYMYNLMYYVLYTKPISYYRDYQHEIQPPPSYTFGQLFSISQAMAVVLYLYLIKRLHCTTLCIIIQLIHLSTFYYVAMWTSIIYYV